jgi:DNA-directed RNA polymerase III subunit RPC1
MWVGGNRVANTRVCGHVVRPSRLRAPQECLKIKQCWNCQAYNGTVRKIPGAASIKIGHDLRKSMPVDAQERHLKNFASVIDVNPDLKDLAAKLMEVISPLDALKLLQAVPPEDYDLLWMNGRFGAPEALIITHVIVPPVCIRPSVAMDAGAFNEDDITVKLQEIVQINDSLRVAVDRGANVRSFVDSWDYLHALVSQIINGDLPGFPAALKTKKPSRGICQRMKGKQGRFRYYSL